MAVDYTVYKVGTLDELNSLFVPLKTKFKSWHKDVYELLYTLTEEVRFVSITHGTLSNVGAYFDVKGFEDSKLCYMTESPIALLEPNAFFLMKNIERFVKVPYEEDYELIGIGKRDEEITDKVQSKYNNIYPCRIRWVNKGGPIIRHTLSWSFYDLFRMNTLTGVQLAFRLPDNVIILLEPCNLYTGIDINESIEYLYEGNPKKRSKPPSIQIDLNEFYSTFFDKTKTKEVTKWIMNNNQPVINRESQQLMFNVIEKCLMNMHKLKSRPKLLCYNFSCQNGLPSESGTHPEIRKYIYCNLIKQNILLSKVQCRHLNPFDMVSDVLRYTIDRMRVSDSAMKDETDTVLDDIEQFVKTRQGIRFDKFDEFLTYHLKMREVMDRTVADSALYFFKLDNLKTEMMERSTVSLDGKFMKLPMISMDGISKMTKTYVLGYVEGSSVVPIWDRRIKTQIKKFTDLGGSKAECFDGEVGASVDDKKAAGGGGASAAGGLKGGKKRRKSKSKRRRRSKVTLKRKSKGKGKK